MTAPGTPTQPWPVAGGYKGASIGRPPSGPGSLASVKERAIGAINDLLLLSPVIIISLLTTPDRRGHRTDAAGHVTTYVIRVGRPVWAVIALALPGALYVIISIGRFGRTLGERRMGLVVRRRSDGGAPGYGRAIARWAPGGILGLGLALDPHYATIGLLPHVLVPCWMFWDPLRQGLHDKVAGVLVVRADPRPGAQDPAPQVPPAGA